MSPTSSLQEPLSLVESVSAPSEPTPTPVRDAAEPVDARRCVEPGTAFALVLAGGGAALGMALLILSVSGIGIAAILALAHLVAVRRAMLQLRASALRVGPRQFPQIHACVESFAERLGLAQTPEVHVFDASEVNAFALRFGRKNGILLTDETVCACLDGRPGALAFVIAHELGHIALGHHRRLRRSLRSYRRLSRLDELSADNVACELVASQRAAEEGLLLLTVGPRLLAHVDHDAARDQAAEVAAHRPTKSAERALTHPVTLRRLDHAMRRFRPAA